MSPAPRLLSDFYEESDANEQEVEDLITLAGCGMPVARIVVVPGEAEAEFYRLNNLGDLLLEHFRGVKLSFPDDEDVEDLAPGAESLVNGHYLLDEFIDRFYDAATGMPEELRVRRPGSDGVSASGRRAALLAVKRSWSRVWSFEPLWQRLERNEGLIPPPRPLLLHAAPLEPLPAELSSDASALLGRPLRVLGATSTGISRVVPVDSAKHAGDG